MQGSKKEKCHRTSDAVMFMHDPATGPSDLSMAALSQANVNPWPLRPKQEPFGSNPALLDCRFTTLMTIDNQSLRLS